MTDSQRIAELERKVEIMRELILIMLEGGVCREHLQVKIDELRSTEDSTL